MRIHRIEKKMPARELAEWAGISRDLLHRIEKGDPRCESGVVFEVATIVGVPLFEPDLAGQEASISFNHFRDKDQVEMDVVLESGGRVAGGEAKAAATVTNDDFKGSRFSGVGLGQRRVDASFDTPMSALTPVFCSFCG